MRALVAYASRHGATAGIADRIASGLNAAGIDAEARSVAEVDNPGSFDAVVVGAAAYMFHWLKDATRFVKRNRRVLADKPVWIFSSGPTGTDLVDEKGQDIFEAARPKEFPELEEMIHPRGARVFFGAWDPDAPPIGMAERFMKKMPKAAAAMPSGDFRDWEAIDAWTAEIVADLHGAAQ
jgi:menaquinone-dependent protoporphyrinogen oxidase